MTCIFDKDKEKIVDEEEEDYGEEPTFSPATGIGTTVANDQGVVWEFTNQGWKAIGRQ